MTAEVEAANQAGLNKAPGRTAGLDEQDGEVRTLEADLFGQARDKHQAFLGDGLIIVVKMGSRLVATTSSRSMGIGRCMESMPSVV